MPVSTSSKIQRVGVGAASLVMTEMARLIRASSPPDATLASGRGVDPGMAGDEEFHLLQPVALAFGLVEQVQRHHEGAAGHRQSLHRIRDGAGQRLGGGLARGRTGAAPASR